MKSIEKDELFSHLGKFLKTKGIELTDGSYAQTVQKSCGMLTDVINLSQKGMDRAKTEVDRKLDQLRQVIHQKTAPKRPVATTVVCSPPPAGGKASDAKAQAASARSRGANTKPRKPKSGKGKK